MSRALFGRRTPRLPTLLMRAIPLVVVLLAVAPLLSAALPNSIQTPDAVGFVGTWTSLALDSAGRPVVSYRDGSNKDLKVLHCGDANCVSGNSIVSPDSAGDVGWYTSLALDNNGKPVVAYEDRGNQKLKLLLCTNANCSDTVNNTIMTLADISDSGAPAMVLDSAGYPVITYNDAGYNVKLLHCGNADCSSGNHEETLGTLMLGSSSSVTLDAAGYPVVTFGSQATNTLAVVHCGDSNCSKNNTTGQPDAAWGGGVSSVKVDAAGNPVVAYQDWNTSNLKVLHCANPSCSSGNMVTPDSVTVWNLSLLLDGSGKPAISYNDGSNSLKVIRCGDVNCSANNRIAAPDQAAGRWNSLKLDSNGYPVVSYGAATEKLKVLHCTESACLPQPSKAVTINQAASQIDPATTGPVHFTAVFAEPVTGFGNGDVTLGGTAGATTSVVTEIAPNNHTTFDVAVSGMTGQGTVIASIPAGAATEWNNTGNLASTSTDNLVSYGQLKGQVTTLDAGCLNFTSGAAKDVDEVVYTVVRGRLMSVKPGGLTYYAKVTAPAARFLLQVNQANTGGWPNLPYGTMTVYDANCKTVSTLLTWQPGTVNFIVGKAQAGGTYYVGVRYLTAGLLLRQENSAYRTATYTFNTLVNGVVVKDDMDTVKVRP